MISLRVRLSGVTRTTRRRRTSITTISTQILPPLHRTPASGVRQRRISQVIAPVVHRRTVLWPRHPTTTRGKPIATSQATMRAIVVVATASRHHCTRRPGRRRRICATGDPPPTRPTRPVLEAQKTMNSSHNSSIVRMYILLWRCFRWNRLPSFGR